MRIVIDANIFVSAAISPHGACGKVLRAILENPDEFELILTEQMIEETIASLNKPRITRYLKPGYDPESWMKDISSLSTVIPNFPISFDECRDPDDVVYLAAANAAKARFIVSGDKDLTVLKRYQETDIISPKEFIFLLGQILSS